ncbi:MAG: TIGR03086 family protein [Chloroflexi bacterium]|nr:TIGR03086 family protein [Chloroflexota bacterium]
MDTASLMQAAAPALKSVAAGVDSSQLSGPTPCSDFSVKELSNHIAGFWGMTAMSARKQLIEGGNPGADIVGDSPASVIQGMVDGGVAAWQESGATEGKTQFGPGEYDAAFAAQITLFEEVVHGWDLAAATGQTLHVPSEVGDAVLEISNMLCANAERGEGKTFGLEVKVADTASSFEKALGVTGRDPNWSA